MIAWRWKNAAAEDKEIYRLMLGCVGRGGSGGDGQAIRDEILHIMHRHHLPECKGTFIEEWHQKLHNNSTPDDIIICEAYLAFLHSNGNLDEFWRVIHENGITRETLRKYERAITTDPVFFADKKGGLIADFNNYLRILKNVHAGADLEKCVEVCRGFLDGHVVVLLQNILNQRGATEGRALAVVDCITEVRQLLGSRLIKEGDITKLRDMLYLDLGLEAQMRLMAERCVQAMDNIDINTRTRALSLWVSFAVENLVYNTAPGVGAIQCQRETRESDELKAVLRDWAQLTEEAHKGYGGDWPTRAMSVVERMRRCMGAVVDAVQESMQAKAEYLGYGLCAVTPEKIPEKWSITLFSEELVRGGGCSFVLSSFLRKLDKAMREQGGGAMWQIISQGDPGAKGYMKQVRRSLTAL
jgi:alpha-glucan,water dikinase